MNPGDARLLRIYLNSDDRIHHQPLYEVIVQKARQMGLAGASVFPGEVGYGCHKQIHDQYSEYSFAASPVVVEIVEAPADIERLLAEFGDLLREGLITVSTVEVVLCAHSQPAR